MDLDQLIEVYSDAGLYSGHREELMHFAMTLVGSSDAADVVADALKSVRSGVLRSADNPVVLM